MIHAERRELIARDGMPNEDRTIDLQRIEHAQDVLHQSLLILRRASRPV